MTLLRRSLTTLTAATLVATFVACSTNPTTGRSEFNMLSREEEIALGAEASPELKAEFGGAVKKPEVNAYITELGQKLAAVTEGENPSLPWEFTLLDSDVINAFALPGGKVFISKGLANRMKNEAELAAVLGHEVGHVTARHTNNQMTRQVLVGGAAAVAASVLAETTDSQEIQQIAPLALNIGGQTLLLRYSRNQELEADALGMRYMVRNGWDPKGALGVMQILDQAMSNDRGMEFLSTHPYPKTRIDAINEQLSGEYAYTQNNPEYTLGAESFQRRYLSKMAASGAPTGGIFAIAQPATWCALCASGEHADEANTAEKVIAAE